MDSPILNRFDICKIQHVKKWQKKGRILTQLTYLNPALQYS